jgi:hypothetical protein
LTALDEAMDSFAASGIPIQPLKGALFLEILYGGNLGLRPMSDLDLLVPAEVLKEAEKILHNLGYKSVGRGRIRWSDTHTHHRILVRGPVVLEVHFRLCHELACDADAGKFFETTEIVSYRGREIAIAGAELQMFHTLLHAATHALNHSALWMIDVLLMTQRWPELDWSRVRDEAKSRRAERSIDAALRLLGRHFPGVFPSRDGKDLRDRLLDSLLRTEAMGQVRSLVIRSLLTDRAVDSGRMLMRKLRLRAHEVLETQLRLLQ